MPHKRRFYFADMSPQQAMVPEPGRATDEFLGNLANTDKQLYSRYLWPLNG